MKVRLENKLLIISTQNETIEMEFFKDTPFVEVKVVSREYLEETSIVDNSVIYSSTINNIMFTNSNSFWLFTFVNTLSVGDHFFIFTAIDEEGKREEIVRVVVASRV